MAHEHNLDEEYDLIIIGGGPAGCCTALSAAQQGVRVLVLEKASFPRDKVCGDILPPESLHVLRALGLEARLYQIPHRKLRCITLHSEEEMLYLDIAPIVAPRIHFDHMLFQSAQEVADTRTGWNVHNVLVQDGVVCGVHGRTRDKESFTCRAKVVVGADGYGSVVALKRDMYQRQWQHWSAGCRAYYRGVAGVGDSIEFFFLPACTPGYVWIAPADNDRVNVGIIVYAAALRDKERPMRSFLLHLLEHPLLKERFAHAERLCEIRAWNLPLASTRRPMHGDGFVLVGDAAGLADPLWGYGLGGAMVSGYIAGQVVAPLCGDAPCHANQLHPYAVAVWDQLGAAFTFAYHFRQHFEAPETTMPSMSRMEMFRDSYFKGAGHLAPHIQEHTV